MRSTKIPESKNNTRASTITITLAKTKDVKTTRRDNFPSYPSCQMVSPSKTLSSATNDVFMLGNGTLNNFEMKLKTNIDTPTVTNSTDPTKRNRRDSSSGLIALDDTRIVQMKHIHMANIGCVDE